MNHKIAIISSILALTFMGCASTSGSGSGSGTTAAQAGSAGDNSVSGSDREQADAGGSGDAAQEKAGPKIADSCRSGIADFIRKTDGNVQVLTSDGQLYQIDMAGGVTISTKVNDDAKNYILLPTTGVIMHFKPDAVMIVSTENGTEFFKLAGDPSKKKAYFNNDATELALVTPKGIYNVWNTEKGFGGIKLNERVQEFINRQSPDHQLGFPGNVTALSIGKNNHLVVALNEPDTGKIGRLFHYEPSAEHVVESSGSSNSVRSTRTSSKTGTLKNLARTNIQVVDVAISPSSKYVAAVDENGQFYFTDTINPGFVVFSKIYQDVKQVMFNDETPILVKKSGVCAVDPDSGIARYEISESYDRCLVAAGMLYCSTSGYFDIRSASDGKLQKRYVFNGDKYGMISGGAVTGNLAPTCIQ